MKTAVRFECRECGASAPQWLGRCPECRAWDALVEAPRGAPSAGAPMAAMAPSALGAGGGDLGVTPTGVGELDRVLAGGVTPGSVTLLGGEPGIGKSTLVLQALVGLAVRGRRGLLVTAEESQQQVAARAERLGMASGDVMVLAEASLPVILATVEAQRPDIVVVDSVHTVSDPDRTGAPGSVTQVQACAAALTALAKGRQISVVLVGHVTKGGELAGPRALEHLVDTVVSFEGDRHQSLRTLRALKHRFGPTGEVGVLEMGAGGLADVADASGLLLADRPLDAPGSVVTATVEGARPLLVEVQTLVGTTGVPNPRRSVQGLEPKRVALLVAVLDRHVGLDLARSDVYASVTGGIRVREPAADLAVALALAGSVFGVALDPTTLVIGEVGLGGELRQVSQPETRAREAARMGFSRVIAPLAAPSVEGIEVRRAGSLSEAVSVAGID